MMRVSLGVWSLWAFRRAQNWSMCAIGRTSPMVSSPQNEHTPMKTLIMPSVYWLNIPKTVYRYIS
jgi:hypothetical protein